MTEPDKKEENALVAICSGVAAMVVPASVTAMTGIVVPSPAVWLFAGGGAATALVSNGIYQKLMEEKGEKSPES